MSKKILYVKSVSILSTNGDDFTSLENLAYLQSLGYQVKLLSIAFSQEKNSIIKLIQTWKNRFKIRTISSNFISFESISVDIDLLFSENKRVDLNNYIKNYKPDLIMTNFIDFDALEVIISNGSVPFLTFASDYSFKKINLSDKKNRRIINQIKNVSTVSSNQAKELKENLNLESFIKYPTISKENYLIEYNKKQFITLINPVKEKGVELFIELAKNLPKFLFLGVGGWNKKYAEKYMKECKYINNLKYEPTTDDIKNILSKTKILLVPSIWQESFGRVCIEAMINGIPVITSKSGGLTELVNNQEFNLDTNNLDKWKEIILKLFETDYYKFASNQMLLLSEKYFIKNNQQLKEFKLLIKKIINN